MIDLEDGDDKIDGLSDLIELSDDFGSDYTFVYSPWLVIFESLDKTVYNSCLLMSVCTITGSVFLLLMSLDLIKIVVMILGQGLMSVMIFGFMVFWDVEINVISFLTILCGELLGCSILITNLFNFTH